MKKFLILLICLVWFISSMHAQFHAAASVLFADGKWYTARVISETSDRIKMEFLHSHSLYEISNDGKIINSSGKYARGQKVKMINIRNPEKSIYNLSSVGKSNDLLGIKFSDGQVYFCRVNESLKDYFTCTFIHTKSIYAMKKEANSWRIISNDRGNYPLGHRLADIYTLSNKRTFYSDGENYSGDSQNLEKEN